MSNVFQKAHQLLNDIEEAKNILESIEYSEEVEPATLEPAIIRSLSPKKVEKILTVLEYSENFIYGVF